jgi:DNA polymerase-3 subunit delta'
MTALFKWQYKDYTALSSMLNNPVPALLLSGPSGIGVDVLIQNYVGLLLCDNPRLLDGTSYACSQCESCLVFSNNNHPDFYQLCVDDDTDKKNINVEDVRSMLEFLSTTTHLGRYKIILIPAIDSFSISSSNALLKILEEPPAYALFILQTDNISGILPTIKSRCLIYKLSAVDTAHAFEYAEQSTGVNHEFWFKYYDNSPLFEVPVSPEQFEALILVLTKPNIDNIFAAGSVFDSKNAGFILGFLTKWLNDLASYRQGAPMRYFTAYTSQIEILVQRIGKQKIFYLFDKVSFLLTWANHPLNYKLQMENLLLQYQSLFIKTDLKSNKA